MRTEDGSKAHHSITYFKEARKIYEFMERCGKCECGWGGRINRCTLGNIAGESILCFWARA